MLGCPSGKKEIRTGELHEVFQSDISQNCPVRRIDGCLNYVVVSNSYVLDAGILVGLPIGFYQVGGFMMWPDHPAPPTVEFSWTNLAIDMAFRYLVSCAIAALYHVTRFGSGRVKAS